VHGTTVATNALLERRGASTALLTTQGCRDVLEIARQTRSELYSLSPSPRDPLIPRDLRFEVPERLDFQGNVITSLDPQAVGRVLDKIKECGAESVAVCFLFSFLRPEHEQIVGALARKRNLFVSLSSDIAPELREYERTATVCANAYVGPVMSRYIGNLRNRLQTAGAQRTAIMQSNGGWLRAEEASEVAVKTVLSGPAGGLIAAVKDGGVRRVFAHYHV
jgi:N-methylhydantoinase A/acetone carboxylase, beta subunit